MRSRSPIAAAIAILLSCSAAAAQSAAPETVVAQASALLEGKIVPLRHFVNQSKVEYDAAGVDFRSRNSCGLSGVGVHCC
jgi:hypothetical protein